MSLIHKALEKVEREEGAKQQLFLRPVPGENLKLKNRPENSWTIYGIIGILSVSLILGLVYFFFNSSRTNVPAPAVKKTSSQAPVRAHAFRSLPSSMGFRRFTLTGITQMGNERTAIINNMLVRTGDRVDQAKVESIEEDKVILSVDGEMTTLGLYGKENTHLTRLEASR